LTLLIPREHGAYGQLLIPLAVGLVIGGTANGALSLAAAAVCAFLAHEPLLVLLGQRGGRASREQRTVALRSLLLFGVVAIGAGSLAVLFLPARARLVLVLPLVLVLMSAAVVASGRERTSGGEVLIALTLTSASVPVVMAGGASLRAAATVSAAFAVAFVSATLAVRAVIAHATNSSHGPRRMAAMVIVLFLIFLLLALAGWGAVERVAIWAAAPTCLVALALLACVPAPRQLRRIGWTIVGATLAAAVVLMATLR